MQQLKSLSRIIVGMLVFSHASLFNFAQAIEYNESPCNNMDLVKGDYCVDSGGELSIVTATKSRDSRLFNRGRDVIKHRHLRKSELNAYLKAQGISISASAGGGGNSGGGGDGEVNDRPTRSTSTTITRTRVRSKRPRYQDDPRVQAQADFDTLKQFCGDLQDRIIDRNDDMKDIQSQIEAIDLAALQKAERDAYTKMLIGCRKDCIKLAVIKDGVCAMSMDKLAEVLSKEDLDNPLLGAAEYIGGQSKYEDYIKKVTSVDGSKACSKMLAKPECKAEIIKSGLSDCEEGATWLLALAALQDGQNKIAELKAKQSTYAKNSTTKNCTIVTAADVDKPHWSSCSSDCLQKGLDSCPNALADAEYQQQNPPYCAECGMNGGAGAACMMYGTCGVSKTAQIIGAIGGVVTPLGLGLMNMSMNNHNLAACTAMYSQQIQLSQAVGLPPTGPNCGGMGGMGGGFMGGMMGMNGMGMNPMMGMQGQMGMNPMMGMNGLGMGFNAGINFGMNPMGMQGQMGMNPMMGMNGMYNPMMMQGQYGMQNQMQTQMYNAQLQMQQNAYQQMAVQNSMMYGYNNGSQMYGLNNMYQSPMYGMGMQQQPYYNPMSMYGGMGMNNYGYGQMYNPMSMYGGAGAGLNFNAGMNFNMGM